MIEEVTVRYRWTLEALTAATRWRFRDQGLQVIVPIYRALLVVGAGLAVTGCLLGNYDYCCYGVFGVIGLFLLWQGGRRGLNKQLRRQHSGSNLCNAEIEWRFTEPIVRVRDPFGSAELSWGSFIKAVRTPEGLMLHTQPKLFHWLPRQAFNTAAEFDTVVKMARRHLPAFRELR